MTWRALSVSPWLEVEAGTAAGGARPAAMEIWGIANGAVTVGVPGEYRAVLSLGGPPPLPPPLPPPDVVGTGRYCPPHPRLAF
jgi:mediator of RNA polymerase II transcription subunit 14